MQDNNAHFPAFSSLRRRRSGGFTLLELMSVVILVGILAAIAVPAAAKTMRERRSARAAHEVVLIYNLARSRAMARGAAVLIRYDHGLGGFEVREAITGAVGSDGVCDLQPATSCSLPDPDSRWADGSVLNQRIQEFKPLGTDTYDMVEIEYTEHAAASDSVRTQADLCITPGGRALFRPANTGVFQALSTVHALRVWMKGTNDEAIGVERTIYIFPNGTARIAL